MKTALKILITLDLCFFVAGIIMHAMDNQQYEIVTGLGILFLSTAGVRADGTLADIFPVYSPFLDLSIFYAPFIEGRAGAGLHRRLLLLSRDP